MKQKVTKKPYFLLEEPEAVDDDLFNTLLGLAVENPRRPLRGAYRPRRSIKPQDAVDDLYPPTFVVCKDFSRVEKRSKSGKASTKFQRLTALSLEKGGSQTANLAAAGFRRVSMYNARTMIEDLLRDKTDGDGDGDHVAHGNAGPAPNNIQHVEDGPGNDAGEAHRPREEGAQADAAPPPQSKSGQGGILSTVSSLFGYLNPGGSRPSAPAPAPAPASVPDPVAEQAKQKAKQKALQKACQVKYRSQVLELLSKQSDGKLGIITSFITCVDLTKNTNKAKYTSAQLEAGTGPADLSAYVELKLGAAYSATHDVGTSGAYEGEYLIACSYLPLYSESRQGGRKIPFSNYKLVHNNASDDAQVFIGPEEMWRIGDEEIEGNMAATLGGDGTDSSGEPAENDSENDSEDDLFNISLLGCEDGIERESDDPVSSEDESEEGSEL
ncbi:hypothetical protein G7Z17_g4729 [Cylindrodendrum hubeiense]|uniref:Uncharacterized protein n=1 Tax=Cylindrodendrum hubeiense TaxID=595255 RepID=A0A9P5HDI1_9HYPO|nr:hypothetical protein G7Z17_g4729 [Cylindrodendrum hubeiense]